MVVVSVLLYHSPRLGTQLLSTLSVLLQEKRKLKEEADVARREAEEAERQRIEELKRSQEDAQQAEHRCSRILCHFQVLDSCQVIHCRMHPSCRKSCAQ